MKKDEMLLVFFASDLRKYEHLYLRGNFQMDMFYDKVDKINAWNRIWLSAKATGVQILSVEILSNHFHITAIVQSDEQRANFKHHLRLSLTQYHNHRYKVHGTLGTRRLMHSTLKDVEDIKDCLCYNIRNVFHHRILQNYLDYSFSTARFVFELETDKQKGVYTRDNLPHELEAYLPAGKKLPKGWMMTLEGMIVPPKDVFRADLVEALFDSREDYLETLTRRTRRESKDCDEPEKEIRIFASDSRKIQDEQVSEFVKNSFGIGIPSMDTNQKIVVIHRVLEVFPKANKKLLSRIFGIPYTTLAYRLRLCRR